MGNCVIIPKQLHPNILACNECILAKKKKMLKHILFLYDNMLYNICKMYNATLKHSDFALFCTS